MSIAVSIDRLREEVARFGTTPFLLTVTDDAVAHATAVSVDWQGDELVMNIGALSGRNAAARPRVSLLWPPFEPGGYSLISDGDAREVGDDRIAFTPARAVLHRPATPTTVKTHTDCTADCVPLVS